MKALRRQKQEAKQAKKKFEREFKQFLSELPKRIDDVEVFKSQLYFETVCYLSDNNIKSVDTNDVGAVIGYGTCLLFEKKIKLKCLEDC